MRKGKNKFKKLDLNENAKQFPLPTESIKRICLSDSQDTYSSYSKVSSHREKQVLALLDACDPVV